MFGLLADWRARVDMYWRCRRALIQGHMSRYMCGLTYPEDSPEHIAWQMGRDGVMAIRITTDFQVEKVW